jgi:hypothetical protein
MRLYEKSSDKVVLELGISWTLAAALIVVHVGAAAIALSMPLAISLRLALTALVAVSLYRALWGHALRRSPDAIIAVELDAEEDVCAVRRRVSDWQTGRLINRWAHPLLTLLVVKCDGSRWPVNVVIPTDAVAKETFRRLRVRLKLRTSAE